MDSILFNNSMNGFKSMNIVSFVSNHGRQICMNDFVVVVVVVVVVAPQLSTIS